MNAYGEYIIFWLFIRPPVFTLANKVTKLSFDFNLQIYKKCIKILFFVLQNRFFFDVICNYPKVTK